MRTQEPVVAAQAHVSYTLRPRLWVAFDSTWYSGGRTRIDDGDLSSSINNARMGVTGSVPVGARSSLRSPTAGHRRAGGREFLDNRGRVAGDLAAAPMIVIGRPAARPAGGILAVAADRRPVARLVRVVVTPETAVRRRVTAAVAIRAPGHLHRREHIAAIEILQGGHGFSTAR